LLRQFNSMAAMMKKFAKMGMVERLRTMRRLGE
jgi:hypothetical protein